MTSRSGGAGDNNLPQTEQLQKVLKLFQALAQGDRLSIRRLTNDMTLEQGTLACFAIGQLLLRHLVQATGKSIEELAAQIALEVGSSPV